MKTFDLITAIAFTIFTIVCCVAGFFNPAHFLFALGSAFLAAASASEYIELRKEDEKWQEPSK